MADLKYKVGDKVYYRDDLEVFEVTQVDPEKQYPYTIKCSIAAITLVPEDALQPAPTEAKPLFVRVPTTGEYLIRNGKVYKALETELRYQDGEEQTWLVWTDENDL